MVEFTKRQKVEYKLQCVKDARRFFGEKNPKANFGYTDAILADAERFLAKLPDRPDIVYKPVWDRVFGAEAALNSAVQDDIKGQFKMHVEIRRDLPNEFVASVFDVVDAIFEKDRKAGRNLLLDFLHALNNPKKLFGLCTDHKVPVPDAVYNDVAKAERLGQNTLPAGKVIYSERDLRVVKPNRKPRPVLEVGAEIKNFGNTTTHASDREEHDRIAGNLVKVHLETIELRMVPGQNKQTYEPQWEAQVGRVLYVLDRASSEPPAANISGIYEITKKSPRIVFVRLLRMIEESQVFVSSPRESEPVLAPITRFQKPHDRHEKPVEPPKGPTGKFLTDEKPAMDPEEAARILSGKNVLSSLSELPQPKAAPSKKKGAKKGKKDDKKQARKHLLVQRATA